MKIPKMHWFTCVNNDIDEICSQTHQKIEFVIIWANKIEKFSIFEVPIRLQMETIPTVFTEPSPSYPG